MKGNLSDYDDFSSDEDRDAVLIASKKSSKPIHFDVDEDENNEGEQPDSGSDNVTQGSIHVSEIIEKTDSTDGHETTTELIPTLSAKDIEKEKLRRLKKLKGDKKSKHKTGVVYLSKIPPYMKPAKLRQILSRFGETDRIFLKREDEQKYKTRTKGGGNKKTMYEEGWAEFIRKKDAKLCASTLNGNIIGGKKGNFYHDDIMNVKYLPGFKWSDLTEQIARENDIRQAKLQLEISQANKLNAEFIRNVEKSKMLDKIKKTKKRSHPQDVTTENEAVRTFKQRKVESTRANAPETHKTISDGNSALDNVIHNLF